MNDGAAHSWSRRRLLTGGLVGAAGLASAALVGCSGSAGGGAASADEISQLRAKVQRLSYNTASGGGVAVKHMPHPDTGDPTVPLYEVFAFNRDFAFCRVDTNPQAFKMKTYAMGEVVIPANQFFMAMNVTTIDQYAVKTNADKTVAAIMRGGLNCSTEVGQAQSRVGDRNAAEHATYRIDALDGGVGGGKAGDKFTFTVFFDAKEAPINHGIFGPEFAFTGDIVDGEITIVDPNA